MNISITAVGAERIALLAEMDKLIYGKADAFSEKDFEDPDYKNFLVTLDDAPIGSTVLAPNKGVAESYDAPLPEADGTLYIISTAILPQFQRQGIGSIIKAWQIAYARRNAFKKIVTNTRASNLASIALNQKFGFRIARTIPEYYNPDDAGEPREDTIVLQLDI